MIKFLLYNSQSKLPVESLLCNKELEDVDAMLLPYVNIQTALELRRRLGIHIYWKSTTDSGDHHTGICVMSKLERKVVTYESKINIDHDNPFNTNKYQMFEIDGYKVCHAIAQTNELYDRIYQHDIEVKNPDLILGQGVARVNSNRLVADNWHMDMGILYVTFKEVE